MCAPRSRLWLRFALRQLSSIAVNSTPSLPRSAATRRDTSMVGQFKPEWEKRGVRAHESCYIDDPEALIGQGTRIWHFSHILPGTSIGEDCSIGQNVVIELKRGEQHPFLAKIRGNEARYQYGWPV